MQLTPSLLTRLHISSLPWFKFCRLKSGIKLRRDNSRGINLANALSVLET